MMPWQSVNADASRILHKSLHTVRLPRLQRDVIPDLPEDWTAIGCFTFVIAQPCKSRPMIF